VVDNKAGRHLANNVRRDTSAQHDGSLMRRLAIAVDGPGSSGKGTVARAVARTLGYQYVDTGAMYRAVAVVAKNRGIRWEDEERVAHLAAGLRFRFEWDGDALRILVDGEDVSRTIRTEDIGQGASKVSALPKVRTALLGVQRQLGAEGGVVMDGRDIGTVVLPAAELKVFLDADLDERARRRHEELLRRGEIVPFEAIRRDLAERDERDRSRAVAPLKPADDAVILDSTEMTIRQAVDRVLDLARSRLAALNPGPTVDAEAATD
jgi:cytidylate kinase